MDTYGKIKRILDDVKELKSSNEEKRETIITTIKNLAVLSLDPVTTTRVEMYMKDFFKISKSDFRSLHGSFRKQHQEAKEKKEKEAIESNLKTKKVKLQDIHNMLREVTSTTGDLIEIVLATMASVRIALVRKLPPVWTIVAGVPSDGKTEHLTLASLTPQVHQIDTLTEAGLASGFVDPKTGKKADKDFLSKLDKGVLVIKDMASLFSSHHKTVGKVLGDLTNIYDGQFKKLTGTVGMVGGDSVFSMICATTVASLRNHHRYMAKIGPRFFTYRLDRCSAAQLKKGIKIIWDGRRNELKPQLREMVSACVYQLLTVPESEILKIEIPKHIRKDLEVLAGLLCKLRAYSSRWKEKNDKDNETYHDTQIEEPFRALQQIMCLAFSLAFIHGRQVVTRHDIELIRRLVLGSGPSDRAEALSLFRRKDIAKKGELTTTACKKALSRSYNRVRDILQEIVEIEILDCIGNEVSPFEEKYRFAPKKRYLKFITKPVRNIDHSKEDLVS